VNFFFLRLPYCEMSDSITADNERLTERLTGVVVSGNNLSDQLPMSLESCNNLIILKS
jgi:hypothetical protein